jgi:hypothetical protein
MPRPPPSTHPPSRRPHRRAVLLLGAGLLGGVTPAMSTSMVPPEPVIEVWVELSEAPPLADADAPTSARQRQRVAAQQDEVGRALAALGAVEIARVQHLRNAIAVRMPRRSSAAVLAIPGVVRLRPTRSLHPPRPSSAPSL